MLALTLATPLVAEPPPPAAPVIVPFKPFIEHLPAERCRALESFVMTFAAQHLTKSRLEMLQCEPLLQIPEAPWLVATLSYTHGNMTRILQLCVREPPAAPRVALTQTGGPCDDEYFLAYDRVAEARAANQSVDALPHILLVESDPDLKQLRPWLLAWMERSGTPD